MKNLFILFLICLAPWAHGADTTCLDKEDVANALLDFSFFERGSDDQSLTQNNSIDLCNDKDARNQVLRGIVFLKKLDKQSSVSRVLEQGSYNYLDSRIEKIYIETKSYRACSANGVIAFVTLGGGRVMHICPGISFVSTDLMLGKVLVHEARHTEGHSHVHCSDGTYYKKDLSFTGACDAEYEDQGSYGVGAAFLIDIYHSTQDQVKKQEARSGAITDFFERFNQKPMGIKSGIIVQSQSGLISFFDGAVKNELFQTDSSDIMTMRASVPTFYGKAGYVKSYVYAPILTDAQGRFAKDYRETFSDADRQDLLDVNYSGDYSCLLFRSKIRCFKSDIFSSEINISTIAPMKFMFNEVSKLLNIVTEDGPLYSLPLTFEELQKSTEDNLLKKSITRSHISLVHLDKLGFRVNLNGHLDGNKNIDLAEQVWALVPEYKDEEVKNILGPYYWSKQLETL